MSELKAGVIVTPHDEGMCFNRGSDVIAVTERETEFYLKYEADKEFRKLQRALWLARAGEASKEVNYWTCQDESSYAIVDFNVRHETIVSYKAPHHRPYKWILIWEEVERKCRKYADKFKEGK